MKRIVWLNDQPASEKQLEYARNLVTKMRSSSPPLSLAQDNPESLFLAAFWEAFRLPDDLTKAEASKLIDYLKWGGPSRGTFITDLFTALLKRLEGGSLNAGYTAIMLVSVSPTATELVVDRLKESRMDLYQAALSVSRARKEANSDAS